MLAGREERERGREGGRDAGGGVGGSLGIPLSNTFCHHALCVCVVIHCNLA